MVKYSKKINKLVQNIHSLYNFKNSRALTEMNLTKVLRQKKFPTMAEAQQMTHRMVPKINLHI